MLVANLDQSRAKKNPNDRGGGEQDKGEWN